MARGVGFHVENSVLRSLAKLRSNLADALVIDARGEDSSLADSPSLELLRSLFNEHELSGLVGREQTVMLVSPDEHGAALAFEAGKRRLSCVLCPTPDEKGWRDVWRKIESMIRRRFDGKLAICLAGGGIEGLFYELGVLRALQYFLPKFPLQDVDILCGISAGAIIGAFMANGIGPEEILSGFRDGKGRLDPFNRYTIFDPNIRELAQRMGKCAVSLATGRTSLLQTLFRLVPSGVFAGDGLRSYFQKQLSKPGMVDKFTETKHRFFVGATDQDTSEHVVFGSCGWEHIPIHAAVRASTALTPFYAPERIDGRYYVDGGFTRTTNVRAAVESGATLVILIDPLVPIVSERPGYVASKGGIMVGMQGLKSLVHGRFDRDVAVLKTVYPHVTFHIFQPEGATMRVMAGSPMKFFYRTEIEEIAFRETIRRVRQSFGKFQHDFSRHGFAVADPEAELGSIKRDLLDEASEVQVA
jgi:predicted acylesterase/phospholipase RssA